MTPQLSGARIFMTGGTGFFGRAMLDSLDGIDAHVTVLTRRAASAQRPSGSVEFINGDVRTFDFPETRFDYVVHLATDTDARRYEANPLEMLDTIVGGTRRTLNFAKRCGARAVLLASSGAVYGRQPPELERIPEEYNGSPDPTDPKSTYGEGKRMAELLGCLHTVPVKIARCFAFVGPRLPLDQHFAIGNFIGDVLAGRPIVIHGDGTPLRSYLYSADLAVWLWTILVNGKPGRAYNTGSGEAISIADLAHLVKRSLEAETEIRILGERVPGRPAERYVPQVERAEKELGLRAWTGLEEAIRLTAAWARSRRP